MIELRWIRRTVPAPEFGEDTSRYDMALQSRYWSGPRISNPNNPMKVTYEPGE